VAVLAALDPLLDPLDPVEVPLVLDAVAEEAVDDGATLLDSRVNGGV
jgi:hypothetical protein